MPPSPERIKEKYVSGKPGRVLEATYFYYDTAPTYNKDLAIVCGGYEKCAPDFDINRSNYPYCFVKYTVGGRGILDINGQHLPLRAGTLTGFQPGTAHRYTADPADPMEHIFVTFVGRQAHQLFHKSMLGRRHFINDADGQPMLKTVQKILQTGLQKPPFSQEICCHYLCILMLDWAVSCANVVTQLSQSMRTYQQCKTYIDMHFSALRSAGQAAEDCQIDVRYMAALFKKYCHIPPSRYIMGLKLNKAANLLLTTDLKIRQIAEHVGFDDPYHFTKNFKQFHGRSPKRYRQEHMHQT
ncbi:MAG TPA: AraC family transcriptional regulator [Anaerohalosphaeraceae bacterium]|nr:AraC family transcriptional regulator [Anaerohalosphaeraceae bacterium]HOL31349.1 AraC family transcriptional regulator [Anaerohalosphaeraceae bacterium]HPC64595.1 AraC family transcriptional regulator [Anaerohalosphaeraceae bacterium]HRS71404.1 AraC family transcriptional regulator [Anaerohalosphaeraceae bacterium]HRV20657.1 AraC family transcriptional regulator [Anaerohalosphaeraceae bacterium]